MVQSAHSAGDLGSIPGSGRVPGGGNGNPLQYSCLENPMVGGAWQATAHGVAKSRTRLSNFTTPNSLLGQEARPSGTLKGPSAVLCPQSQSLCWAIFQQHNFFL